MPSLIVLLALTVSAAWLAARPMAGEWFHQLLVTGPAFAPALLTGGWSLVFLSQALAAWAGWRMAGRHATPWLLGCAAQWPLWVAWSWTLLQWHRPGWSLGVLGLACLLQWALLVTVRGLGAAALVALLPAAAWLPWLGWINYRWWLAHGGGLGSIIG